jgi:O-methyltransferase
MPLRAQSAQLNSPRELLRALTPPILVDLARALTQRLRSRPVLQVPHEMLRDEEFYRPHFSPWEGLGAFKDVMATVAAHSTLSPERVWVLYSLAQQARHLPGTFWECGVYRGGSATVLERVASSEPGKCLRLFDTFCGTPPINPARDFQKEGTFSDTSLEQVKDVVGRHDHIVYHSGFIPETFEGLEAERISIAHIDVVQYQSVMDCCSFIYPRVSQGGFIVFDDYGFRTCPGARAAVDEFFSDKPERPLVLPTRQAIVFKLPSL